MCYVWHSFLWSITPPFYKLSLHFLLYHPFQKLPLAPPSPHEIKKNFEHWWNYEIIADYCSKKSSSHEEYNRHTFFFLVVWSTKNIAALFKIPLYTWNMMWKCLNCFFLNLLLYFSIDSTFWKFSSSKKFPFPPFYNPPTLVFLLFILTFLYPSPYSLFGEVLSLHLAKERVMKLWPNNSVTEVFCKEEPMKHWHDPLKWAQLSNGILFGYKIDRSEKSSWLFSFLQISFLPYTNQFLHFTPHIFISRWQIEHAMYKYMSHVSCVRQISGSRKSFCTAI